MPKRLADVILKSRIQRTHLVDGKAIGPDDLLIWRRFIGRQAVSDGGLREDAEPGRIAFENAAEGDEAITEYLRLVLRGIALGNECHYARDIRADAPLEEQFRVGGLRPFVAGIKRHNMKRSEFLQAHPPTIK
jgi:hypothetical protein